MRRLIACAIVSRDGCCAGPVGDLPPIPWSRELGDESLATLDRCDTILYGRHGFERDRAFWQRADLADLPTARLLARYPKLVCSTTLADPLDWNARALRDPPRDVAAYLATPGKDVVLFGSPTLLAALAPLVGEVRAIVAPCHLPGGRTWMPPALELPLRDTRALPGGAAVSTYCF